MWRKYHPPLDGSSAPAITLNDVDDVMVRDCEAQAGTGTFLALNGAKTQNIELRDNDVRKAKVAVMKGEEVSAAGRAPLTEKRRYNRIEPLTLHGHRRSSF